MAVLILNHSTECGWVVNAIPLPLYPQERDPVTLYRRMGGPQGWSGQVLIPGPSSSYQVTILTVAVWT
jgi:hypothetical protein